MPRVVESEKELRFTRSSQAVVFWLLGAVATMAAITLLVVAFYRSDHPALPHPAWALVPSGIAAGSLRLAVHLNRHAYIILTPLGIDLFPFFRPAKGMRTVFWQQIKSMDVDSGEKRLTLHFDDRKQSGIHLSLGPIDRAQRPLLLKALAGRLGPADSGT